MRTPHLLLAEDNPDHLLLLSARIRESAPDAQILCATNQDRVLTAVANNRFDCIVLDYNLAGSRAPDIIPRISALAPETPIIVTSAGNDQDIVIASLRTGVTDFIHKDEAAHPAQLWARVENAVKAARARVVERRKTNRRLVEIKRRAETDPLTGLFNRRYADRVFDPDRSRSDRRSPHACVMIDLDHFKSINDSFGHDAGDAVIKHAADRIHAHIAPSDVAIRWGGEEFVVIKASCTLAQAAVWAHALRADIARSPAHHDAGPIPFTASLGVTSAALPRLDRCLVSRADQALYHAKDSGRNRVATTAEYDLVNAAYDLRAAAPTAPTDELVALLTARAKPQQSLAVNEHSIGVSRLARAVALALEIPTHDADLLATAARHHDIGKLAIPEEILAAPRALNEHERALVDRHTQVGALVLSAFGLPAEAVTLVAHHHDRHTDPAADTLNPRLRRLVQILTACDAADAMLSDRPYSAALDLPTVKRVMRSQQSTHFAASIIEPLCTVIPRLANAA